MGSPVPPLAKPWLFQHHSARPHSPIPFTICLGCGELLAHLLSLADLSKFAVATLEGMYHPSSPLVVALGGF